MEKANKKNPKKQSGVVVSNKMQNTVVVVSEKIKQHPVYKKRFKVKKRYYAHTDENLEVGSKVIIQEHKPFSKLKRWIVVSVNK